VKLRPGQKIEVIWQDAAFHPGWHERATVLQMTSAGVRTAGYFIQRSKVSITVALSLGTDNDNVGEVLVIPKAWIQRIKKVR